MPHISATDAPLLWAVRESGSVIETGFTHIGETTISGLELVSNTDENAFLGAVVGGGASYNPLPPSGWLEAGEIYGYNGGLCIVRQSHNRTEHAPETIPSLFVVYREDAGEALEWVVNEPVQVGTRRLYQGAVYHCLQAHVTQVDYAPNAPGILGVLWSVVVTTPEWAVGVAYKGDNTQGVGNGDIVTYSVRRYRCRQSHTSIVTWTPVAAPALWLDLGPV